MFGTNGGMGVECSRFISHLASKLANKQDEKYSTVTSWIRTRLSFEILKSAVMCLRGSRPPWRKPSDEITVGVDFELNAKEAEII